MILVIMRTPHCQEDDHNDYQELEVSGPCLWAQHPPDTLKHTTDTPQKDFGHSVQKIYTLYVVPVTNMRNAIMCSINCNYFCEID